MEVVGDGFGRPAAVKFDSHGRLYLVDYLTGELWQINTQTGKKRVLIQLTRHLDNLAFDSQDHLIASHGEKANVYEIQSVKRTDP